MSWPNIKHYLVFGLRLRYWQNFRFINLVVKVKVLAKFYAFFSLWVEVKVLAKFEAFFSLWVEVKVLAKF
jgi:hypothetical protein